MNLHRVYPHTLPAVAEGVRDPEAHLVLNKDEFDIVVDKKRKTVTLQHKSSGLPIVLPLSALWVFVPHREVSRTFDSPKAIVSTPDVGWGGTGMR